MVNVKRFSVHIDCQQVTGTHSREFLVFVPLVQSHYIRQVGSLKLKPYRLIAALMVAMPLFSFAQQDFMRPLEVEADKHELGTWKINPEFHVAASTYCESKGDIWPSEPVCTNRIAIRVKEDGGYWTQNGMRDVTEKFHLSVAGRSGTGEEVYGLLMQQEWSIIRIGVKQNAGFVELKDFARVANSVKEREFTEKNKEVSDQRLLTVGFILLGLVLLSAGIYLIRKGIEMWPRLANKMASNRRETMREFQGALKNLWMRKVVQEEIYRQMTRDAMAEAKSTAESDALRKQIKLARDVGNHDLATTLEAALRRIES